MIYEANAQGLIILGIILGFFALVALVAFLIYRFTHLKIKNEKPSEEEVLKEEMDRLLKPISSIIRLVTVRLVIGQRSVKLES